MTVDYSVLDPLLSKLAKPAQRALINYGIRSPQQLAKLTLEEVLSLHGIGPSAIPVLKNAMKKSGLEFRRE